MQLSNLKSVIIGVGAAATVIAITGAAAGSGVGAVFNLGETNKVNATSSLTGSTKHSMLSVTNNGAGTALNLHVAKGKAPFSVNSSAQVAGLNASLLSGLAASQFVQGGGQSRSFGFTSNITTPNPKTLLSVPGFGTLSGSCNQNMMNGTFAEVSFLTGSQTMDKFTAALTSSSGIEVDNTTLSPNTSFTFAQASGAGPGAVWQRHILRYATGSGQSLTEHIATIDLMVGVDPTTMPPSCDFDASAIIGAGATGP